MNKINLISLQNMANERFTTKKIEIGEYEINIDTVFRDSKITEMIKEFLEKLEYAKVNNIIINNTDYVLTLMVKFFSDIEFPEKLEDQLKVFTILVDLGIINLLMNEWGDEGMKVITEKFNAFNENLAKLTDELKETANKNDTKNFVSKKRK